MSRNFDGELSNQSGASYRSENNDWAQDWLTNRSGSGSPSPLTAYGTFFNTSNNLFYVTNSAGTSSQPLFHSDGYIRTRMGEVALPAHSFLADPLTGAYLAAGGTYSVSASGVQALTVISTDITLLLPTTYSGTDTAPLTLHRTLNTGQTSLVYTGLNSTGSTVEYGALMMVIQTNTAGSEQAYMTVRAMRTGTLTSHTNFIYSGYITTGTAFTQITNTDGTLRHAAIEQNSATSGQVLAWNGTAWAPATAGSGTVSGSGTVNYIPKFTTTTNLGNSVIQDQGDGVYIAGNLEITGRLYAGAGVSPTTPLTNVAGELLLAALEWDGAATNDVLYFNGGRWAAGTIATVGVAFSDLTGSATDAQIPNALTLDGSTINNSVIGAGTPAAATFTNLTVTGIINSTSDVQIFRYSGGASESSNILLRYSDTLPGIIFRDATTDVLELNEAGIGLKTNAQVWGVYTSGVTGLITATQSTSTTGTVNINTLTLTNDLAVADGGTGLSSGTSGGIPYFSSTTTMASSGVLAATYFLKGGGAGLAPSADADFSKTTAGVIDLSSNTAATFNMLRATTNANGPAVAWYKTRGTIASPTPLSSADVVGSTLAYAYHSTGTPGYVQTGIMRFITDGTESGNTVPTAFEVWTMASGGSLTKRLTIASGGGATFTGTLASGALTVTGAASTTTTFTVGTGFIEAGWASPRTVTIASGTIAVTSADLYIFLAAESGTADTLDTITGGTTGQHLYLVADLGDTITLTNAAGGSDDFITGTGANLTLNGTTTFNTYHFVKAASAWVCVNP